MGFSREFLVARNTLHPQLDYQETLRAFAETNAAQYGGTSPAGLELAEQSAQWQKAWKAIVAKYPPAEVLWERNKGRRVILSRTAKQILWRRDAALREIFGLNTAGHDPADYWAYAASQMEQL